jgi:hypothetical protein
MQRVLVCTNILLLLPSNSTLPFPRHHVSCSFSSRSLDRLLVLSVPRWRLAAESGYSFGASVHRASSGGRQMKPCSRVPKKYVSDHGQKSRTLFVALALPSTSCRCIPLQQPQPQLSDHLLCYSLLASVVVLRPWASAAQHCSGQMLSSQA